MSLQTTVAFLLVLLLFLIGLCIHLSREQMVEYMFGDKVKPLESYSACCETNTGETFFLLQVGQINVFHCYRYNMVFILSVLLPMAIPSLVTAVATTAINNNDIFHS